MPKGVYQRTASPWNKGQVNYDLLEKAIQTINGSAAKLTVGQIFSQLVANGNVSNDRRGYKKLDRQLVKARESGKLDKNLIYEGRGRPTKFSLGDKVRIDRHNERTPKWLRRELRLNTERTIVAAVQARGQSLRSTRYYYLGSNRLGNGNLECHAFRAMELMRYIKGNVGRPRSKRRYLKRNGASEIKNEVKYHHMKGQSVALPAVRCHQAFRA